MRGRCPQPWDGGAQDIGSGMWGRPLPLTSAFSCLFSKHLLSTSDLSDLLKDLNHPRSTSWPCSKVLSDTCHGPHCSQAYPGLSPALPLLVMRPLTGYLRSLCLSEFNKAARNEMRIK